MKVRETETKQFKPIELTIQDETEATVIWCALNVSTVDINKANSYKDVGVDDGTHIAMFTAFNAVFDPRKK